MRVKNSTQRFQAFVQDVQESFWGDFQGRTREMLKKLLEADAEQQMAEHLGLQWHERAPVGQAGGLPQRVLRAELRDPIWRASVADSAHAAALVSAAVDRAAAAPRAGGGRVDPASVFARNFHAPSGTCSGGGDRRSGECANGLAADPRAGSGGARVSSSAAGGRLGLLGSGWSVAEGAAVLWAAESAVVGGLRNPQRRHAGTAGLHAGQE